MSGINPSLMGEITLWWNPPCGGRKGGFDFIYEVDFISWADFILASARISFDYPDCLSQHRKGEYKAISNPRTTGYRYYESCIVGMEDNLIKITVWFAVFCRHRRMLLSAFLCQNTLCQNYTCFDGKRWYNLKTNSILVRFCL